MRSDRAHNEWVRGWPTVLAGSLGQGVGVIHLFSLGLFFAPLEQEFGWSRTQVAFGLTIASVMSALGAPIVGRVIDKRGSRTIAMLGLAIYASGLALLALSGPEIALYWCAWGVLALGAVMVKPTVWVSGAIRWFNRNRGLAIAILLSGGGVSSALIPSLSIWLIAGFGWRMAYLGLALVPLAALPLVYLFFDRRCSGDEDARQARVAHQQDARAPSLRSEFMSLPFVSVTLIAFVFTSSLVCVQIHFVPISVAAGLDLRQAAFAAGAIGVFSVVGRMTAGVLLDRFRTGTVGAAMVSLSLGGAIILLSLSEGQGWYAILAGALLGIGLGAELDVIAYYFSKKFGRENFGLLFGTFVGVLTLASGTGSLMGSAVFDHFGDYEMLKWIVWPSIAATVLVFSLLQVQETVHEVGGDGEPARI